MEDIPDDEKECANWLHKLYQEKVKLGTSDENVKGIHDRNSLKKYDIVTLHKKLACKMFS